MPQRTDFGGMALKRAVLHQGSGNSSTSPTEARELSPRRAGAGPTSNALITSVFENTSVSVGSLEKDVVELESPVNFAFEEAELLALFSVRSITRCNCSV